MRILIVGNGGREHALLWKLARDAPDAEFFITEGNGGTGRATPWRIAPTDARGLGDRAAAERVDLAVVGPEAPLAAGIADHLAARGIATFGPSAAAAEIESSKAFAKDLMRRHGIPTAGYRTFSELGAAEATIRSHEVPLVVKASGLAAGKGAVVCETTDEALAAAREMLGGRAFGDAGAEIVIEEFMPGEELSVFALTDGATVLPMLPAQDHKRVGEGDTGPNTGGMGAYAPVSIATPALVDRVAREILVPTVRAMAREGRAYRGLLYAGLMVTDDGPRVVEFNCRFGDPETQVVLPLLESSLLEPMLAIARGEPLPPAPLRWRSGAAVTTVLAAPGYPGSYPKGLPIRIPPELHDDADVVVFHAGTAIRDGALVTTGGRILAVTALAATMTEAAERSRSAVARVQLPGGYFRRDIGYREERRTLSTG